MAGVVLECAVAFTASSAKSRPDSRYRLYSSVDTKNRGPYFDNDYYDNSPPVAEPYANRGGWRRNVDDGYYYERDGFYSEGQPGNGAYYDNYYNSDWAPQEYSNDDRNYPNGYNHRNYPNGENAFASRNQDQTAVEGREQYDEPLPRDNPSTSELTRYDNNNNYNSNDYQDIESEAHEMSDQRRNYEMAKRYYSERPSYMMSRGLNRYTMMDDMLQDMTRSIFGTTLFNDLTFPLFRSGRSLLSNPFTIMDDMRRSMMMMERSWKGQHTNQALLERAERYLNDDVACSTALGSNIETGSVYSSSSSSMSPINGQSRRRKELQVGVRGSMREGTLRLYATDQGIQEMMLDFVDETGDYREIQVQFPVEDLFADEDRPPNGRRPATMSRNTPDDDVLDVEAIPDEEEGSINMEPRSRERWGSGVI